MGTNDGFTSVKQLESKLKTAAGRVEKRLVRGAGHFEMEGPQYDENMVDYITTFTDSLQQVVKAEDQPPNWGLWREEFLSICTIAVKYMFHLPHIRCKICSGLKICPSTSCGISCRHDSKQLWIQQSLSKSPSPIQPFFQTCFFTLSGLKMQWRTSSRGWLRTANFIVMLEVRNLKSRYISCLVRVYSTHRFCSWFFMSVAQHQSMRTLNFHHPLLFIQSYCTSLVSCKLFKIVNIICRMLPARTSLTF